MKERIVIGGYDITPEIEERLHTGPDLRFEYPDGNTESFVFGKKRQAGDPHHSVFYRRVDGNGMIHDVVGGGITPTDALKAVGREVYIRVLNCLRARRSEEVSD